MEEADLTDETDIDENAIRREKLSRLLCAVMGWECRTAPVWAGLRKVALGEAVVIGLDKLQEILNRLEP